MAINTPQLNELLEKFQRDENNHIPNFKPKQIVKPIKTRWNSFHDAFERAVELRNPIDNITHSLIERYEREAPKRRKNKDQTPPPRYVEAGGLNVYDWNVITEYL